MNFEKDILLLSMRWARKVNKSKLWAQNKKKSIQNKLTEIKEKIQDFIATNKNQRYKEPLGFELYVHSAHSFIFRNYSRNQTK